MKLHLLILLTTLISSAYGQQQQQCITYECLFDGIYYEPGDTLDFACFQVICNEKWNWQFLKKISNCEQCWISNDPHFYSFEKLSYDWHGRCNYSLSQPCCDSYPGDSYNPPFGIYGSFQGCGSNPSVSCLRYTTYKLDEHTSLTIFHNDLAGTVEIEINGNSFSPPSSAVVPYDCSTNEKYPVIFWKDETFGNCVRIVGKHYSIEACPDFMYIFLSSENVKSHCGLCGHYTGLYLPLFPYFMRPCGPGTNCITEFAISWKTNEYCRECYDVAPVGVETQCQLSDMYLQQCTDAVNLPDPSCAGLPINNAAATNFAIQNCVKDCCAEPERCDHWKETAALFVCGVAQNDQMQTDDAIAQPDIAPPVIATK